MQTHLQKGGDIPGEFPIEFILTTFLKTHYFWGTMEAEHYEIGMCQDTK